MHFYVIFLIITSAFSAPKNKSQCATLLDVLTGKTVEPTEGKRISSRANFHPDMEITQSYLNKAIESKIANIPDTQLTIQEFNVIEQIESEIKNTVGKNYIISFKSKNPHAKTVLFGAHYDSYPGELKLDPIDGKIIFENKLTPGADDNASGVAALFNIMDKVIEYKKTIESLDVNYTFAFFDAEEIGFQGSIEYVKSLKNSAKGVQLAVIFDRVGRSQTPGKRTLSISLNNFTPKITAELNSLKNGFLAGYKSKQSKNEADLDLLTFPYGSDNNFIQASDSQSFKSTPVILISSMIKGIPQHFHTPQDTPGSVSIPLITIASSIGLTLSKIIK